MKVKQFFIIAIIVGSVCIESNAQYRKSWQVPNRHLQETVIKSMQFQSEIQKYRSFLNRSYEKVRNVNKGLKITLPPPSKELLEYRYWNALFQINIGDTVNGMEGIRFVANYGLKEAQYFYAQCCLNGVYVKKDISKGIQLMRQAVKQNYPEALNFMGEAYYYGYEGFRKDSVESVKWYTKSAKSGCLRGQLMLGDMLFNNGDSLKAIEWWEKASKDGKKNVASREEKKCLSAAVYNLGICYFNGLGIAKDESKGVSFLKEAIEEYKNAEAAYMLGLLYQGGTGLTPQNDTISCSYFRLSALYGYPEGEAEYGNHCKFGIGMVRDSIQAVRWYKKAYQDGYTPVAYVLTFHYYDANDNDSTIFYGEKPECRDSVDIQKMVGEAYYGKEEYNNAEIWWKKAAEQQDADACYVLYALYDTILKDSIASFEYLKKAAELGNADALCNLGFIKYFGSGVKKNEEEGLKYMKKSAELGCAQACYNIGLIFYEKKYKRRDYSQAVEYWKRGAELGSKDCQYNYGYMLKKGKGVKKDKEEAVKWFKFAAQKGSEEAKAELKKMKINIEEAKAEPKLSQQHYRVTDINGIGIIYVEN